MKLRGLLCLALLCSVVALPSGVALGQQTSPPHRKYLFQAAFTPEGIKNYSGKRLPASKPGWQNSSIRRRPP